MSSNGSFAYKGVLNLTDVDLSTVLFNNFPAGTCLVGSEAQQMVPIYWGDGLSYESVGDRSISVDPLYIRGLFSSGTNINYSAGVIATIASPSFTSVSATTFTGALVGNADTATALATARLINGISFNGTSDITVTAAAGTLTGSTLATGVLYSSLTEVGTVTTGTWSATTMAVAKGGTGSTTALTNGQLWIGSTASPLTPSIAVISPTTNQTTVTNGAGSITIGTVQNIGTGSSPTFTGLILGAGTEAAPSYSFTGYTGTGIYLNTLASSNVSFTIDGYRVGYFYAGGLVLDNGLTMISTYISTDNIIVNGLTDNQPVFTHASTKQLISVATIPVANGGTNIASYTAGDLLYASATTTLTKLPAGATGNVLLSGTSPSWGKVALTTHVSGILPVANGGTNIASYTAGDLLYASATTTLTKLPAGVTGNVLLSGTSPSWGKVALTTHVSGILPVANGGTGNSTALTDGQLWIGNNASPLAPSRATIQPTANQTTVTNTAGGIQIGTVQDIATTSTVRFGKIGLGMAATNVLDVSGSGTVSTKLTVGSNSLGSYELDVVGSGRAKILNYLWVGSGADTLNAPVSFKVAHTAPATSNTYGCIMSSDLTQGNVSYSTSGLFLGTNFFGTGLYARGLWVGEYYGTGTWSNKIGMLIETANWNIGLICKGGAVFGAFGDSTACTAGNVAISSKLSIGTTSPGYSNALDVTGVGAFSTGIQVASGATLDNYTTITTGTATLSGFSGSPTMAHRYVRIGNIVHLHIANVDATFGGATAAATFTISASFRPSAEVNGWVKTRQAGAWTAGGSYSISAAGTCSIYKDVANVGFTAGAANCGWAAQTLIYYV